MYRHILSSLIALLSCSIIKASDHPCVLEVEAIQKMGADSIEMQAIANVVGLIEEPYQLSADGIRSIAAAAKGSQHFASFYQEVIADVLKYICFVDPGHDSGFMADPANKALHARSILDKVGLFEEPTPDMLSVGPNSVLTAFQNEVIGLNLFIYNYIPLSAGLNPGDMLHHFLDPLYFNMDQLRHIFRFAGTLSHDVATPGLYVQMQFFALACESQSELTMIRSYYRLGVASRLYIGDLPDEITLPNADYLEFASYSISHIRTDSELIFPHPSTEDTLQLGQVSSSSTVTVHALDQLVDQAKDLELKPVLVTNKPVHVDLALQLIEKGIDYVESYEVPYTPGQ